MAYQQSEDIYFLLSAASLTKMLLAIRLCDSTVSRENSQMDFFVKVVVLTEHVHKYESASYCHHTTRVFILY